MDILITDVTEMHASNYCVAGWDAGGGRMIRPLPGGSNWTGHLLAVHSIQPGATIRVVTTGGQPNSAYPHRTEDTPVDAAKTGLVNTGPSPWFWGQCSTCHGVPHCCVWAEGSNDRGVERCEEGCICSGRRANRLVSNTVDHFDRARSAGRRSKNVSPLAHAEILRAGRHVKGGRCQGARARVCRSAGAQGHHGAQRPHALSQAVFQSRAARG